jgi:hypothetical protein
VELQFTHCKGGYGGVEDEEIGVREKKRRRNEIMEIELRQDSNERGKNENGRDQLLEVDQQQRTAKQNQK